jgi:hypothetical protein
VLDSRPSLGAKSFEVFLLSDALESLTKALMGLAELPNSVLLTYGTNLV